MRWLSGSFVRPRFGLIVSIPQIYGKMKNIFGFVEMFMLSLNPKPTTMKKQTDLNPWAFLAIMIAILYIVNQIENF